MHCVHFIKDIVMSFQYVSVVSWINLSDSSSSFTSSTRSLFPYVHHFHCTYLVSNRSEYYISFHFWQHNLKDNEWVFILSILIIKQMDRVFEIIIGLLRRKIWYRSLIELYSYTYVMLSSSFLSNFSLSNSSYIMKKLWNYLIS